MELKRLDAADPAGFYLPHPSLADLSDCYAMIAGDHSACSTRPRRCLHCNTAPRHIPCPAGTRLPLHSQVLSTQCSVLRGLFCSQREGAVAGEQQVTWLSTTD